VVQKYHTKIGKPLIQNESAENMFNNEALQDFADYLAKRLEYPAGTYTQATMVGHGVDKNGDDVFQLTIKVSKPNKIQFPASSHQPMQEMWLLKELLSLDLRGK